MITYELAKQLKDTGFPNMRFVTQTTTGSDEIRVIESPTLSELIESCGKGFSSLTRSPRDTWYVASPHGEGKNEYELVVGSEYPTPEIAVANLWLELNKKI